MSAGEIPADFELTQDGNTKLAPERFANAGQVFDCCQQLLSADRLRAPWRASIDGLIDGNPVYALQTLKAKGQSWRSRVNYREAEGLIQSRQGPFYDLVTEVNPCIEVCLDYAKGVEQTDMAQKIAKNFHWMLLKRWRSGFNYHIPLQQLEMLKHGIGFHVWPGNKTCWIPRTPVTGQVLFPDGVSLNLREDLDYFMLRDFLPGYALYSFIRNEKQAASLGWNVDSVWEALAQTSKLRWRGTADYRTGIEQFQREMKAGDIGTTMARQSGLWLNHLFVKEIGTDKISQYTVAEGVTVNGPRGARRKDNPFQNCLFRKRNRFNEWPLVIFPYCIANGGLLHTVRGLGARTKDFFELSNRIKNAMADQVLIGSTLNVQQTGAVDPEKLRLMRLGMMTIIPQNLQLVAGVKFPDLNQGPLALSADLKRTVQENNEGYMQPDPEAKDRETAQSFAMRMQNAGQVAKGAHSLYASNYQQMLERMFRIASSPAAAMGNSLSAQLAKEFQDRCAKDGIPPEALAMVYEVNEIFSTGAGSPAARLNALMTAWQYIYPTTTEPKKINLERDLTAALFTSTKVDRYARSVDDNELPDSDASLAVQENNGLMEGGDALAVSEQDQVGHLHQHLQKAEQIAQQAMQGQMDPQQALAIIRKFGQHCADHLKFLAQNPMRKAEFEALHKEWLALSVIADKLDQQVQAMLAAQPQQSPQEQVSDNLKIGMAKVAANNQINQAKLGAKTQLDLRRLAIDGRIKAATAVMNARNGARKAAA